MAENTQNTPKIFQSANPKFTRRFFSLAILGILLMIVFVFAYLRVHDPLMNYYGVRMQRSVLYQFLDAHPPTKSNFSLHCVQVSPFSLDYTFTCFDTKQEADTFIKRRFEVEQMLNSGT